MWQVWQATLSVWLLSFGSEVCGVWPWQDWQVAALRGSTLPRSCAPLVSNAVGV
jgi:hypothetical protein